jgi:hypothetical protein
MPSRSAQWRKRQRDYQHQQQLREEAAVTQALIRIQALARELASLSFTVPRGEPFAKWAEQVDEWAAMLLLDGVEVAA